MKTSKNSKNYKVRCTGFNAKERYFTKGKVYEVKDGTITNDNGYVYGRQRGQKEDVIAYLKFWYNFEVVEKVEEPKFTKYEDGQFVRVVKKYTHHFPLGQIVKVVEHKTGFFDEEGVIMCEGFCENIRGTAVQCVLPEEIAPLD